MLTVPIRTVRIGHVASPYGDMCPSVQDTWQLLGVTRVIHLWTFQRTGGPFGK